MFLNVWQQTSDFVSSLRSKPIWTLKDTKMRYFLKRIRKEWKAIQKEAIHLINQRLFMDGTQKHLTDTGAWHVFFLYLVGDQIKDNCARAPITCGLIKDIPQITDNVKGSVLFSLMESGTHVHPHSGISNDKLRVHLGLDVPITLNGTDVANKSISRLRVKDEYITWKNGEMVIWDDSFDHEVWHYHPLNHSRLILIFDILHPDLTEHQIATL